MDLYSNPSQLKPGTSLTPSLKTVARKSGFSISTVSRALNGSPLISDKTVQSVKKIAEKLGYRPHLNAQLLAGKKSKLVTFVTADYGDYHDARMVKGIEDAVKERGYTLFVCFTFHDQKRSEELARLLCQSIFGGVIIGFSAWEFRNIWETATHPTVYLDQWLQNKSAALVVTSDHAHSAALIMNHFTEKNVRRVYYIGFGTRNTVEKMRFDLIRKFCRKAAVSFNHMYPHQCKSQTYDHRCGVVIEPNIDPALCLDLHETFAHANLAFFDEDIQSRAGFASAITIIQDRFTMGRMAFEAFFKEPVPSDKPVFYFSPVKAYRY